MPTQREREYYQMGFNDGFNISRDAPTPLSSVIEGVLRDDITPRRITRPKRKLSAWNKFVKANSKKKEFRYRDGKLNLKKMGVAFRRKKRR